MLMVLYKNLDITYIMSRSAVLSGLHKFFIVLKSIIYAKTTNKMWLRLLLILAILLFLVIIYKNNQPLYVEGFEQNDSFVLKQNIDSYDEFYVEKYDEIMKPEQRAEFEIATILKMTNPTMNSIFLDVGSGTGHLVSMLEQKGYRVFGIDKSPAMVEKCEKQLPNNEIVCKDILDPMAFEHNTFSHILCTGFTIYEIKEKDMFFKNCYHWLIPNGYMLLHLVNRDTFNPIIPAAMSSSTDISTKYKQNRITKTNIDFPGFSYSAEYIFPKEDNKTIFTEKFFDNNGHIRQNERTLYMESIDSILKIAMNRGFIVHAQMNMSSQNGDENQYLYILERAM